MGIKTACDREKIPIKKPSANNFSKITDQGIEVWSKFSAFSTVEASAFLGPFGQHNKPQNS
jgi:hypothetical protein